MFHKATLKNGLRIITVPMSGTKTVTVLVLVGTGSKYETKEINGLSHFIEHMFFKGTKKRPNTLALAETLDRVGGQFNAFTDNEITGYWAKVSAQHLDLALDWVADIFLNSKLEPKEIAREKKVIIEEINRRLDMPAEYVGELWEKLLYGDQPAGWSIAGPKEVVAKLEKPQFFDYLAKQYVAANTIICLAGEKNKVQNAKSKIQKYFKNIKLGKLRQKPKVVEIQRQPQSLIHYKKTDQTHFCLGVRAYHLFHPDKYALGLLAIILGGNMSSRLWIAVRERQALAYSISTASQLYTDSGYLVTQAGVDNQRTEKAIQIILKEYKKIVQKKVSQPELQKAKDCLKGRALLEMESSDAQASFVGFQELLTKEILTSESKFAKIDAVTVEDIQRVAQDIFKPAKLNLALIGPFKEKKKFEQLLKL